MATNPSSLNSNIVNFAQNSISDWKDFGKGNLKNVIYRIDKTFTLKYDTTISSVTSEFVNDHCKLIMNLFSEADSNGLSSYTFNEGELYLFISVESEEKQVDIEPLQVIPLAPSISSITSDQKFINEVTDLVNAANSTQQYITRNQLRIRSNNIQAWVVNNFIPKNGNGSDSNYIPGTVKVTETDSKFEFLSDKIISSDNSVDIRVSGQGVQKLDITTKFRGIAFADVNLSSGAWTLNQTTGLYELILQNNQDVLEAIGSTNPNKYTYIKNIDTYLLPGDESEFSVNKIYNTEIMTDGSVRNYLWKLTTVNPHDCHLVMYLTNGTVPKDSGGGGGSGPSKYVVGVVENDNSHLKLQCYNNGQTSFVNFTPDSGAKQLSELTDFINTQAQPNNSKKLQMFNSFLDMLVE